MLHSSREPVLQRGAGEREPRGRAGSDLQACAVAESGVLDVLRLVQDHVAEARAHQLVQVAADQRVGGQHEVRAGQVLHSLLPILPVPHRRLAVPG